MVRHDIVGTAAFDLGGVDAEARAFEGFQPKRQGRRRDDGIAPVLRIAPGVGRLAGDDQAVIAAAAARARQGAIGQGSGFVSERRYLARRQFGNQWRRGKTAGFLVRIKQDIIARARGGCAGFKAFSAARITAIPPFMSATPGPFSVSPSSQRGCWKA